MRNDIQKWPHGYCEAGLPSSISATRWLPPCSKKGRWMVGGIVLCGGCKRAILGRRGEGKE